MASRNKFFISFLRALTALFFVAISAFGANPTDSLLEEAIQKSRHLALSQDNQWLKLLHYENGFLGGRSSQVASRAFFLSPQGDSDSQFELEETLRRFFSPKENNYQALYTNPETGSDRDQQHPLCQFPARFIYLRGKLALPELSDPRYPRVDCSRFFWFKKSLAIRSVALVFSSFFLNSPSSAFGHTFLRISKSDPLDDRREQFELMDQGIGFAAEMDTSNVLVYALKGIVGLFRGTYSNVPYYMKVREYNDSESRDLWSYDLDLTPEEEELLVAHLWELGAIYFRYYYFTQNCSYHILTAIEAAAPRYEITRGLKYYVIPTDTVKQVHEVPGLVKGITYRPSARSRFYHRYSRLSEHEKDVLGNLVHRHDVGGIPSSFFLDRKVEVLDTAIDFIDYRTLKNQTPQLEEAKWRQEVLLARSSITVKSQPLKVTVEQKDQVQSSHDSARALLELGSQTDHVILFNKNNIEKRRQDFKDTKPNQGEQARGDYFQFGFRFALNDLLDRSQGFPPQSELEFFHTKMRYFLSSRHLRFEELVFFRLVSLTPYHAFNPERSWGAELKWSRANDSNCNQCLVGSFLLKNGWAWDFGSNRGFMFYFLGGVEPAFGTSFFGSNFRLGMGPETGVLISSENWKILLSGIYRFMAFSVEPHFFESKMDFRWNFGRQDSLGLKAILRNSHPEASVSYYHYL